MNRFFSILVALFLVSLGSALAAEERVRMEGDTLIFEMVTETRRVENVPPGVSTEEATWLVTGAAETVRLHEDVPRSMISERYVVGELFPVVLFEQYNDTLVRFNATTSQWTEFPEARFVSVGYIWLLTLLFFVFPAASIFLSTLSLSKSSNLDQVFGKYTATLLVAVLVPLIFVAIFGHFRMLAIICGIAVSVLFSVWYALSEDMEVSALSIVAAMLSIINAAAISMFVLVLYYSGTTWQVTKYALVVGAALLVSIVLVDILDRKKRMKLS